jgi:TPP-dependent 2-oxoacid decarboxylase
MGGINKMVKMRTKMRVIVFGENGIEIESFIKETSWSHNRIIAWMRKKHRNWQRISISNIS